MIHQVPTEGLTAVARNPETAKTETIRKMITAAAMTKAGIQITVQIMRNTEMRTMGRVMTGIIMTKALAMMGQA